MSAAVMSSASGAAAGFVRRNRSGHGSLGFLLAVLVSVHVLEGAARKWLAPGLAPAIYLSRDFIALLIYAYVYLLRPAKLRLLEWAALFSFTSVTCFYILDAITLSKPLSTILVGLRNYGLYAPLAFVIAYHCSSADIAWILRIVAALALPLLGLTIVQIQLGQGHYINSTVLALDGDTLGDADVFLADGWIRPSGTFAFTKAYASFVGVALAITAAGALLRRSDWAGLTWFSRVALAAYVMVAPLSGAREALAYLAACIGAIVVPILLAQERRIRLRSAALPFGTFTAALIGYYITFPAHVTALGTRLQTAAIAEEGTVVDRAARQALSFTAALESATLLGTGPGMSSPSALAAGGGDPRTIAAEFDNERNVVELGFVLGSAVVLGKFALAGALALTGLMVALRRRFAAVLPISVIAAVFLVGGQITFSSVLSLNAWLLVGLACAMIRLSPQFNEGSGHLKQFKISAAAAGYPDRR